MVSREAHQLSGRAGGELVHIQYLRGLAAMSVVLFHAVDRLGYRPSPVPFLDAGVDVFFVVSGFLMWVTTCGRNMRPGTFIRRRVTRIVPLYWMLTAVTVAVALARPQASSAGFDLAFIAKSFLFVPAYHPVFTSDLFPVIIPGWTLNYEMLFYALFALSLWVGERRRLPLILLLILLPPALRLFLSADGAIARFYTDSIVVEFAFGVVLGWLFTRDTALPGPMGCAAVAIGLLLLAVFTGPLGAGLPRCIDKGVPALLIVAGAAYAERAGWVLRLPTLRTLGDASYSIYLTHGIVLSAVTLAWDRAGVPAGTWRVLLFPAVAAIVCALAGIVCFRLLERPVLRALGGLPIPSRRGATEGMAA